MLGIVALHCLGSTPYETLRGIAPILGTCVNGFVIISGWYGIRFALSKILRLYGTLIYATLAVSLIWWCQGCLDGLSLSAVLIWIKDHCAVKWFFYAYVVVILFAPLVNLAVERLSSKHLLSTLIPFLLLSLWSFLIDVPIVGGLIPETPGLGSHTGLSLLSCYVVGRCANRFKLDQRLSTTCLLIFSIILCFLVGTISWGGYASPFAILLGLMTFLLVLRLPISGRWGQLCSLAGPSMFAIYLLHANTFGIDLFHQGVNLFYVRGGLPLLLSLFITSIAAFLLFLLLDLPRRLFVFLATTQIKAFCSGVDRIYSWVLDRIERFLIVDRH